MISARRRKQMCSFKLGSGWVSRDTFIPFSGTPIVWRVADSSLTIRQAFNWSSSRWILRAAARISRINVASHRPTLQPLAFYDSSGVFWVSTDCCCHDGFTLDFRLCLLERKYCAQRGSVWLLVANPCILYDVYASWSSNETFMTSAAYGSSFSRT